MGAIPYTTKRQADQIMENLTAAISQIEPKEELPEVTAEDIGKSLVVNNDGKWSTTDFTLSKNWSAEVITGFEIQPVTAIVGGFEFTKTSDVALTAEQLTGAQFMVDDFSLTITADMLSDMSDVGVTGTILDIPDAGTIMFSCTEAGDIVSEPGCYLVNQYLELVPVIFLKYRGELLATVLPITVGTFELTDGVSDLPTGVVYLQIEE